MIVMWHSLEEDVGADLIARCGGQEQMMLGGPIHGVQRRAECQKPEAARAELQPAKVSAEDAYGRNR